MRISSCQHVWLTALRYRPAQDRAMIDLKMGELLLILTLSLGTWLAVRIWPERGAVVD